MKLFFKIIFLLGVITVFGLSLNNCSVRGDYAPSDSKFENTEMKYQVKIKNLWEITKAYASAKPKMSLPKTGIPIMPIDKHELLSGSEDKLYRLGHSTILLRLNQEFILIDPVFSERASPFQWLGPKRFHPSPIRIEELPPIKAVIISHNHYDHLDKASIKRLQSKTQYFLTPLRVGLHLQEWGIDENRIVEFNWWDKLAINSTEFIATPAQHFSGRGLLDRDKSLWAGWIIKTEKTKLFFSGDSGYFNGFKQIGERYGPFDITMIETGAYNPLWQQIHMLPHQSVQAHLDLRGKVMLPIHNGTFDLSLHDWYEPFEKSYRIAQSKGVDILTPVFGEVVRIAKPSNRETWWRKWIPHLSQLGTVDDALVIQE